MTRPTESWFTPLWRRSSGNDCGGGEASILTCAAERIKEKRAVFCHDQIENSGFGKNAQQVWQLAAGHQKQFPSRLSDALQGCDRGRIDVAVMRDRSIVIRG